MADLRKKIKDRRDRRKAQKEEDLDNKAIGFSNGWNSSKDSQTKVGGYKRAGKFIHKGFKKGSKTRVYADTQFRRAKKLNSGNYYSKYNHYKKEED